MISYFVLSTKDVAGCTSVAVLAGVLLEMEFYVPNTDERRDTQSETS